MDDQKPLTYKDTNGTTLYGIPELNKSIQAQTVFLKKYYYIVMGFVLFLIGVILWGLWQVKHYKIISLLINSVGCIQ